MLKILRLSCVRSYCFQQNGVIKVKLTSTGSYPLNIKLNFFSILPAPIQPVWDRDDDRRQQNSSNQRSTAVVTAQSIAPPYGQRRGWVPRVHTDYGGNE